MRATAAPLIIVAIVLYGLATTGAASGAAVHNDADATLSDIKGNTTDALDETRHTVMSNFTAVENATVGHVVNGILVLSQVTTVESIEFGYHHPLAAKANNMLSPWLVIVGLLYFMQRQYRRVKQR